MAVSEAMVVAPQPEATEVGAEVLAEGGNAIDAAVACALTQTVVDPMMCGLAGFGSLAVHTSSDRKLQYLDFHSPAPSRVRTDMWVDLIVAEARDGFGFLLDGHVNELGYESVCVPATLRALHTAQREMGVLPWSRVVEPAIGWARNGWVVRPHVERVWWGPKWMGHAALRDRVTLSATGKRIYCREDGTPKRLGDEVRNPEYADVLEAVAVDVEDFYRGSIAKAMVTDIQANGGYLTMEDLATYRPEWNEPLWGEYRGIRIGTNRPPGGGAMLIEMLNILEHFDPAALGHNSVDYIATVAEVMRQATVDKDRYLADPEFVDVPLSHLMSTDHAKRAVERIQRGDRIRVPRLGMGDNPDTTHLSVVDFEGTCVAMTHSLGISSGVITDGLGFMYNACMSVFDPRPNRTHSIQPGKRRFSSIMPTIVYRNESPFLVIGAPGGTQIAMGVLQVIINVVDFGCSLTEAVLRPRFSATSDIVDVVNRIPRYVTDALAAMGQPVNRIPESYGVALVHGIKINHDGSLEGGADPAADGVALSVRRAA